LKINLVRFKEYGENQLCLVQSALKPLKIILKPTIYAKDLTLSAKHQAHCI